MTVRSRLRPARLAWGIGLCSLGLLVASLVLLVLDWKAIDSPITAGVSYFVAASVTGILGTLIAARRPRNPVGWLLLGLAITDAIYLLADFTAIRGLLSGATPGGWVAWAAWVFNMTFNLGSVVLLFTILFFPSGRLLPGARWRWAAWLMFTVASVAIASAMIAVDAIQLSPRLPSVLNPLAVPALDGLTNGNGPLSSISFLLVIALVLTAVVVRLRSSRNAERTQMRWFAYVAAAGVGFTILGFAIALVAPALGDGIAGAAFYIGLKRVHSRNDRPGHYEVRPV